MNRDTPVIHIDHRKHVFIPNDGNMKLEDLPPQVALRLQKDALDALESLVVFLALEEVREVEAKDHLENVVDVLVRGGRL